MSDDIGRDLEALRGEIARLRLTVEAHHRELMAASGEAPGPSRPVPTPPPHVPARLRTPAAVSRHAGRWVKAVLERDVAAVARIEDLMRRSK